jgi:hypothetical protein
MNRVSIRSSIGGTDLMMPMSTSSSPAFFVNSWMPPLKKAWFSSGPCHSR